jgi:hypothetical protein
MHRCSAHWLVDDGDVQSVDGKVKGFFLTHMNEFNTSAAVTRGGNFCSFESTLA